jgi:hypothetical protein
LINLDPHLFFPKPMSHLLTCLVCMYCFINRVAFGYAPAVHPTFDGLLYLNSKDRLYKKTAPRSIRGAVNCMTVLF